MSEQIRAKRLLIDQAVNWNNNFINNLRDPLEPKDAANMRYVQLYVEKYMRTGIIKDPVVAATTANFTGGVYSATLKKWTGVIAAPVIDGVNIQNGQSFLIKNAVDPRGCGVWVYDSAAAELYRREDFDNIEEQDIADREEVRGGVIVPVQGGATNDNKYFQLASPSGAVVLDTDALIFEAINPNFSAGGRPSTANKKQFVSNAILTAAGGSLSADQSSTGITLAEAPVQGGYVDVRVGGISHTVGSRTTDAFYFSSDGGATAKTPSNYAQGDTLYVNPSVLGFVIDGQDRFDIHYNV